MMLLLLLESALHSLGLGAIVWLGLKALRVRSPQVELTAWTIVLAAALAMPLLMQIATVTIPARLPLPASVAEVMSASPTAPLETSSLPALSPEATVAPAPQATTDVPIDWQALATGTYLLVVGLLLLRLAIGVAMIWRLSRAARPIRESWADGSDVRMCRVVGMPVTFGRVILLPADCAQWSAVKRQAVLSHERSHVARGDYTVLLLAALHRAIFWFNPLSWWLMSRLAALMEAASDDAAIEDLRDRRSYAEILLDIAASAGRAPAGVAMARPATVAQRIERILREKGFPMKMGRGRRTLVAASLLPVALMAAGTIAQTPSLEPQPVAADPMILSAGKLASVSPGLFPVNPLETPRAQFQILPVFLETPAAFPAAPRSPLRLMPLATLADVQLSPSPAAPSSGSAGTSSQPKPSDGAKPVDMNGTWTMLAWGRVDSCTFQQTGNKLGGTCKTFFGEGPVSGSIDGQKVEWRWLYKAGRINYIRDFKVAIFTATLLPDNRLEGGFHIYGTYDEFHPSFRVKTSILIERKPGRYFTANKQPSDPS